MEAEILPNNDRATIETIQLMMKVDNKKTELNIDLVGRYLIACKNNAFRAREKLKKEEPYIIERYLLLKIELMTQHVLPYRKMEATQNKLYGVQMERSDFFCGF